MQGGKIVFQGDPSTAVTVFAQHGFPCPPLTNPADHLMDVISPHTSHIHVDARASFSNWSLTEPPIVFE